MSDKSSIEWTFHKNTLNFLAEILSQIKAVHSCIESRINNLPNSCLDSRTCVRQNMILDTCQSRLNRRWSHTTSPGISSMNSTRSLFHFWTNRGESLSSCGSHLGSKHQERPQNGQNEKTTKPPICSLNDSRLSPL